VGSANAHQRGHSNLARVRRSVFSPARLQLDRRVGCVPPFYAFFENLPAPPQEQRGADAGEKSMSVPASYTFQGGMRSQPTVKSMMPLPPVDVQMPVVHPQEMDSDQAKAGIFTNERGNLKVVYNPCWERAFHDRRACVLARCWLLAVCYVSGN